MSNIDEFKEFSEYIEELGDYIVHKNNYIFSKLKNRGCYITAYMGNLLSIFISSNIIEDLKFLFKLNALGDNNKYIYYILRGMVEQIIEYIYLIKNTDLISEYFGLNIDVDDNMEIDINDLVNQIRKFGGNRYSRRRVIRKMAEDIGELESNEEKLSLYTIFSMISEKNHNSYYEDFLNTIEYIHTYNNIELTEIHNRRNVGISGGEITYLYFMLTAFRQSYEEYSRRENNMKEILNKAKENIIIELEKKYNTLVDEINKYRIEEKENLLKFNLRLISEEDFNKQIKIIIDGIKEKDTMRIELKEKIESINKEFEVI